MKFGKVTDLGQFVSDFDPDPDHDKKKLGTVFYFIDSMISIIFIIWNIIVLSNYSIWLLFDYVSISAPFFTVTKKREREKSEEDMAWQVAQQIIGAVMTETSSDFSPSDTKDA